MTVVAILGTTISPYLFFWQALQECEDLRAVGTKFQVNRTVGKSNMPMVGPRGAFLSMLLARGWVDEVGSDLHRPTPEGRPFA